MNDDFYCTPIMFGSPEFDEALKLRYKILRKPLGLEYDSNDIAAEFDSIHLGCYDTKTNLLAAVLILKPIDSKVVKMRQVAVDTLYQSRGIGFLLVSESERLAKSMGFSKIELHARDTAVNFYLKSGYDSAGDVFKEVGINHLFMYKSIN